MNLLHRFTICIALLFAGFIGPAKAVSLNEDGTGQALLFPYYTVRSTHGDPFNTLLTIANHTTAAKAIRVRFREGRNSREVASFNLFLSPNDAWAAAVVPTATGTRLISRDQSCVSPALTSASGEVPGITFTSSAYLGDGSGDDLDRTREGWIEVIEMATLTGSSAAAVTHQTSGTRSPANCAAVQGPAALDTAAPTGGLAGTLTLINVATGLDFALNAVALADLAGSAYYRPASDAYPDFNAVEIAPASVVVANGFVYRSTWSRGVDAVSAVLMRSAWFGEFNLDTETVSTTDFAVTFPTRHHYVAGGIATAPFIASCQFARNDTFAGEPIGLRAFNREEELVGGISDFNEFQSTPNYRCGPATVVDFHNSSAHTAFTPETLVLGSTNRGLRQVGMVGVGTSPNGWAGFTVASGSSTLTSLSSSSRTNVATGATTGGAHQFSGLPVIGFAARTFINGTLTCSSGACKASYGGAFPLRFTRTISPSN